MQSKAQITAVDDHRRHRGGEIPKAHVTMLAPHVPRRHTSRGDWRCGRGTGGRGPRDRLGASWCGLLRPFQRRGRRWWRHSHPLKQSNLGPRAQLPIRPSCIDSSSITLWLHYATACCYVLCWSTTIFTAASEMLNTCHGKKSRYSRSIVLRMYENFR